MKWWPWPGRCTACSMKVDRSCRCVFTKGHNGEHMCKHNFRF